MKSNNKKFRIVDLFCGLGGLTAGIVDAANESDYTPEIVLANDINHACMEFYKHNFKKYLLNFFDSSIEVLLERIRNGTENLYDNIDLVLAGPPCQGNSDLNNKTRRSDPKNSLYLKAIEFIAISKPKFFIIENVPSVIHAKQNVVDQSLSKLTNMEYDVYDFVVDFEQLGIAQTRKRHVLIGSKKKNNFLKSFLTEAYLNHKPVNLKDVLEDLLTVQSTTIFNKPSNMMKDNQTRVNYLFKNNIYDLPNHMRPKCHQKNHSYKSMYGRLNWDKPAQTLTGGFGSMGQGRFIHPKRKRVITPHEAARIQGLPDWLEFDIVKKRTDLHQMIGNAVPPVLSMELFKQIIKELE
jgi:DNA (cytosine-5)-methyltransferase 1